MSEITTINLRNCQNRPLPFCVYIRVLGSVLPAAKLKLTTKVLIMLTDMTQFIVQATYLKSLSHREKIAFFFKKNNK